MVGGWYVDAVCDHLEAVARRQLRKLVINFPPRHGKSLFCAVLFPAWVWTWDPSWRGLFAAYADDLAQRDSITCRALLESEWYASRYSGPGGWGLRPDSNRRDVYHNTRGGFRQAFSVEGKGTGYGGNCTLADDPLKAIDALSPAKREACIFWWDQQMSTRLDDADRDCRVIVQQRLHEEDLSGHVLAQGGYEHLSLPTEYDPARRARTFVDLGGERRLLFEDPRAEKGELLCPERFSSAANEEAKRTLGAVGYAAQHDQAPVPLKGNMFLREWWRFHKQDGDADAGLRPRGCYAGPARVIPAKLDQVVISLDATFKRAADNDFVSFTVWGAKGADRYLLDRVNERLSFTETLLRFDDLVARWPAARKKLVEAKANGDAIVDVLRSSVQGLVLVEPQGGKEARAFAIQPQVQAGNCYLPDGAPWLEEFVGQLASFPGGRYDDDVDSTSQALLELVGSSSAAARWRALAS